MHARSHSMHLLTRGSYTSSSSFQYLTPRIRITPCDLADTPLFRPMTLHFVCSPTRAAVIMSQVAQVESWSPLTVYEPIPVRPSIIHHLCRSADVGLV